MKTILFTAAILMIGASIYGFVDYRKNSHKKEFKKLYTQPVAVPRTDQPEAPVTESKGTVTDSKNAVLEVKSQEEKPMVNGKKKQAKKKGVKKRKVDYRIFSRAPLDDEYLDKEAPLEENAPENK